jgi:response regulator RpfG family c-di-GMP phosphodiesterase
LEDGFAAPLVPESHQPPLRSPPVFSLPDMLSAGLVAGEDWEALTPQAQETLSQSRPPREQLALLLRHGLLTEYQASQLEAGNLFGLILGSYRVLEPLGSGGMGTVFRAEHVRLRRPVAIKVLHPTQAQNPQILQRFHREIRAVARLQHPNVVAALDVGEVSNRDCPSFTLHFFVMEHVPGQNLEQVVRAKGPLPVTQACEVIARIAGALVEAEKHHLVHRDIKPSNIQLAPSGEAKLLDFGLALLRCQRLTMPGMAMGSLHYMAPEQAEDASTVDIRADIYGLGGTLFWCLTGKLPCPTVVFGDGAYAGDGQRPIQVLEASRPDVPAGLREVLKRMLAVRPEDRYATPQALTDALAPYLKTGAPAGVGEEPGPWLAPATAAQGGRRVQQVLIVDDDPDIRDLCRCLLQSETIHCDEAGDGVRALEATGAKRYDLVLLDIDMPNKNGREVLRHLRENPSGPHLKVILFSGSNSNDDLAELLLAGADDFVTKPFSLLELQARVQTALRFKQAQDRSDLLNHHLLASNRELEQNLNARDASLIQARNSLVLALTKLVEYRDSETGQHLSRMQQYSRQLAEEAAKSPPFDEQIDANFIDLLVACVPLHDIGKVIVPDHILLKPGKLDSTERIIVQRHTVVGREALAAITMQPGLSPAFLQMAIDIASHHHERYDGKGYPDQLAGTAIPLAARIVAIADVYDALRSRRVYKPSLSHATAVQVITKGSEGQFDPNLLKAFANCAYQLDRIFKELPD